MSEAARDNEDAEADKHPVKGKVPPLAHEVDERERDGEIGGRDEEIGDEMKADETGIPEITMAMGHETVVAEKRREEVHAEVSASECYRVGCDASSTNYLGASLTQWLCYANLAPDAKDEGGRVKDERRPQLKKCVISVSYAR
ncbi:MAG: hypothetical protein DLM52_08585 [Chthoniobacterales bacterium]|nr:MAG: hypothetical protein DLM52_08585 [Chthoniobacterales bacterium]